MGVNGALGSADPADPFDIGSSFGMGAPSQAPASGDHVKLRSAIVRNSIAKSSISLANFFTPFVMEL